MTQTTAKIKKIGKHFEILIDMEKALKFKKGLSSVVDFLETDKIFTNSKSGDVASGKDLKEGFGTEDINQIAIKIVKDGEILVTQEHRTAEQEARIKQVIDFLARNAIDPQMGRPLTTERIKNALEQANVNIKNMPVENQINDILSALQKIIPIRLEMKRVKITIPAIHTGKAYGVVAQYKENENWLSNGSLEVTVSVPSGLIMDFYEKLNGVTHGSALTEEIK